MSKTHIHPVPADFNAQTLMDRDTYEKWYAQSLQDPDTLSADRARDFPDCKTPRDTVSDWDLHYVTHP